MTSLWCLIAMIFLGQVSPAAAQISPPAVKQGAEPAKQEEAEGAVVSYTRGKDLHEWGGKTGRLISQAFRAMDAGSYSDAIGCLNEVVALNATDPEVYLLRAAAYELNKQPEKALADLSASLKCNAQYLDAWQRRGDLYARLGNLPRALEDYSSAVRLAPASDELRCGRGNLHLRAEQFDKAIEDFTEAIRLEPGEATYYSRRALAHFQKSEVSLALTNLDEAICRDTNAAPPYLLRGDILKSKRRFSEAIQDYEQVIRLEPADDSTHNELGWLLATCSESSVRNGKHAIEHATQACKLVHWKNVSYLDTLAAAYAEAGDFASAMKFQKQALAFKSLSEEDRAGMQERLTFYEGKRAWRE